MICHLGAGKLILDKDMIGVFDLDGDVTPPITAEFLRSSEKKGIVETAADDIPRSFVLTAGKNGEAIIVTRLSSAALFKRLDGGEKGSARKEGFISEDSVMKGTV